jgi:hypothetical protein
MEEQIVILKERDYNEKDIDELFYQKISEMTIF